MFVPGKQAKTIILLIGGFLGFNVRLREGLS